jgi:beta-lactamase class A
MRSGASIALLVVVGAAGCRPTPPNLEASLRARLDALDAQTSLYAKDMTSGREVAIRADEPKNTLSVIKIPVMVLAYREAQAGRFNLDQRHTIRPEELRRGSGLLQTFATGLAPTYRDLIMQMIITSDNTATDILINRLGLGRVNQMLADLGYRETRLRATTGDLFRGVWEQLDPSLSRLTDREVFDRGFPTDSAAATRTFAFEGDSTKWLGRTTAREISRLLEQIHRGELASRDHSAEMIRILRRQFYSSRLPRFIAFQAGVAHKTGDWPPYAGNDVGIIFAPGGPIVVAVFATQNRGDFVTLEETHGHIARDLLTAWGGGSDSAR